MTTVEPAIRSIALTSAQIREAKPPTPPAKGLGTLVAVVFKQTALNPFNLGFALGMPILMYMMFGANQAYSEQSVGAGNVAASVLVSMTLFGVMLSTASFGANVSLERAQGIGRLYALTPLGATWQIVARLLASIGMAALVIAATFTVGFSTGAAMSGPVWIQSAAVIVLSSVLAAVIGFGCGFAVRSDGAFAATSAIVVLSAFMAGMTIPLEQMGTFFRDLAPWTPLWGVSRLTLLPLYGWDSFTPNMLVNVLAWTGAFGALAVWGLRNDTSR